MTTIFVSFAKEDAACAEEISRELEAKGYTVGREPKSLSMESLINHRTIENDLLGSAAVILVWSSHAAQSELVERHRMFAERLKKLIVPLVLDGTDLPNTLVAINPVPVQVPCTNVIAQITPSLPAPDSLDALIAFYEQAAHNHIAVRKEAIDHAAKMLRRDEHRAEVLAVLEYLAKDDLITGVRDKAQEVLVADAKRDEVPPPPPFLNLGDASDIIGVRCSKGHISSFNVRRACTEKLSPVHRRVQRAGKELDELEFTCKTCNEVMMVPIDCEGYR
jgi:hypothetical protein